MTNEALFKFNFNPMRKEERAKKAFQQNDIIFLGTRQF